jgi:hypothetical protein
MKNVENNSASETRNHSTELDAIMGELQAYDPDKVRQCNVDPATIVARVIGCSRGLTDLRMGFAQHLPSQDFNMVLSLPKYAYALLEANDRFLATGKAPDEIRALAEEGDKLRSVLRSDARALIVRNLLDATTVESCTGGAGYKVIATELGVLATAFTAAWPQIRGKSGITEQELQRAWAIEKKLIEFVGTRDQSPQARAASKDLRDRAFSVLADMWDETRRAVGYLRWHEGDAEELAPSIWQGQGNHHITTEDPPANTPTTGAGTSPANPQPATPSPAPAPVPTPVTPVTPTLVGKPNSQPFMV